MAYPVHLFIISMIMMMISKMISPAALPHGLCQLYLACQEFIAHAHRASRKKEMESITGYERTSY
jgi:hypothetical protein